MTHHQVLYDSNYHLLNWGFSPSTNLHFTGGLCSCWNKYCMHCLKLNTICTAVQFNFSVYCFFCCTIGQLLYLFLAFAINILHAKIFSKQPKVLSVQSVHRASNHIIVVDQLSPLSQYNVLQLLFFYFISLMLLSVCLLVESYDEVIRYRPRMLIKEVNLCSMFNCFPCLK